MDTITNPNCIVKAFENKNVSILHENINETIVYYFKGSDVANALDITNISSSIQHYTDKEKGLRECDTLGGKQKIIFLTSRGVYRLLYNSKKKIAEQFREWVGDILDDIIFNQSKELTKQLKLFEEKQKLLEDRLVLSQEEIEKSREQAIIEQFPINTQCIYFGKINNKTNEPNELLGKGGSTNNLRERILEHRRTYDNFILLAAYKVPNKVEFENDIKKHPVLKYRFRNILIDEKNRTELISYDKNFTLKTILEIFQEIIKEKELEIKYGVYNNQVQLELKKIELESKRLDLEILKLNKQQYQLQQPVQQPVHQEPIQQPQVVKQESIQQPQVKQEPIQQPQDQEKKLKQRISQAKYRQSESFQQRIQSDKYKEDQKQKKKEYYNKTKSAKTSLVRSDVEKSKFVDWLKIHIKQQDNKQLIWGDLLKKYLQYKTSSMISNIYKQYFIEYASDVYPNVTTKCMSFRINNIRKQGYQHFYLHF